MSLPRAFVWGCAQELALSADEIAFLRRWRPWGMILFRRNVANRIQLAALTQAFREAVERPDAPVFVDQEGGRVQRLAPPHWMAYPAASAFAGASDDLEEQTRLAHLSARLIAHDLREVGISVDCLPVLDLPAPGSHPVIGSRAYGADPAVVARLGRSAAEGLLAGGVLPVIKHMPGHGRAQADSHLELPRVDASLAELEARDFASFRANADLPIGMTAHVVFDAIDPVNPGTLSPAVVGEVIRGRIGFDGLLVSDDLSMKALSGGFGDRTRRMFAAGVDIALHCNGDLDEAALVADASPALAGRSLARAEAALARIAGPVADFDPVDARAELTASMGGNLAASA